ncbi:hypothetical protein CSW30_10620, partial [Thermus scotoductus]
MRCFWPSYLIATHTAPHPMSPIRNTKLAAMHPPFHPLPPPPRPQLPQTQNARSAHPVVRTTQRHPTLPLGHSYCIITPHP